MNQEIAIQQLHQIIQCLDFGLPSLYNCKKYFSYIIFIMVLAYTNYNRQRQAICQKQ